MNVVRGACESRRWRCICSLAVLFALTQSIIFAGLADGEDTSYVGAVANSNNDVDVGKKQKRQPHQKQKPILSRKLWHPPCRRANLSPFTILLPSQTVEKEQFENQLIHRIRQRYNLDVFSCLQVVETIDDLQSMSREGSKWSEARSALQGYGSDQCVAVLWSFMPCDNLSNKGKDTIEHPSSHDERVVKVDREEAPGHTDNQGKRGDLAIRYFMAGFTVTVSICLAIGWGVLYRSDLCCC